MVRRAKSLAQLKLDAKRAGWADWIRHPNDERAMVEHGCWFDPAAAERVREFFLDLLTLTKGSTAGEPFAILDWWYDDVIAPAFGWKRPDGRRRFDKVFVTTAKKSAKTTVASGLAIYLLRGDREAGAHVFSAAVDRDQASLCYDEAANMVEKSPELSGDLIVRRSQKRIIHRPSASFYEAISADADSAEGKNPHGLIVDELHAWRNRAFFQSLMYGDIAREQPMMWQITTAGDDDEGIGFEEYDFAKRLLDPDDPLFSVSHFACIHEADSELDWYDPKAWMQANPSIAEGIGSIEKLQSKADEARGSPRKISSFERYICNRWVGAADNWLDLDAWKECEGPVENHAGQSGWFGMDLSQTRDLTAICGAFWRLDDPDILDLLWWFWLPAEGIKEKEHIDRVPYRQWVTDGWLELTPGPTIDYSYIRRRISGWVGDDLPSDPDCIVQHYNVEELAFDPYNAHALTEQLDQYDGLPLAKHRQGFLSMSSPSKEFERRVINGTIRTGGNPIAHWMARNAVINDDPAGNIKPEKRRGRARIDGIVAAIMAVGRAASAPKAYSGSLFVTS
jgi:phage terminase large subunit-like protein